MIPKAMGAGHFAVDAEIFDALQEGGARAIKAVVDDKRPRMTMKGSIPMTSASLKDDYQKVLELMTDDEVCIMLVRLKDEGNTVDASSNDWILIRWLPPNATEQQKRSMPTAALSLQTEMEDARVVQLTAGAKSEATWDEFLEITTDLAAAELVGQAGACFLSGSWAGSTKTGEKHLMEVNFKPVPGKPLLRYERRTFSDPAKSKLVSAEVGFLKFLPEKKLELMLANTDLVAEVAQGERESESVKLWATPESTLRAKGGTTNARGDIFTRQAVDRIKFELCERNEETQAVKKLLQIMLWWQHAAE